MGNLNDDRHDITEQQVLDPCQDCAAPALCAVIGSPCQEKRNYLALKNANTSEAQIPA